MFALAFRCWLLLSLVLGALGTPWWAVADGHDLPAPDRIVMAADRAGDNAAANAASRHDCHGRDDAGAFDTTAASQLPAAPADSQGHDCDGPLCDCGCVLPPLLIPALLALPAGIAPPAPRLAALPAPHAPALNTPFRPPIG